MLVSKQDWKPDDTNRDKLARAIKAGFIIEHEGCYELTALGKLKWASEQATMKGFGNANRH